MQAQSTDQDSIDLSTSILGASPLVVNGMAAEDATPQGKPTCFHGHFESCMEMAAPAQAVAQYLDAHRSWFPRCAHPMDALPLGENGYALQIGRFGSFGYEVDARIGLDLLPQDHGVYRIQTIAIPGYEPPGYHVDFQAALQLVETSCGEASLTQVEWELDLKVTVQFPRFIHALPQSLIQSTGDRLLNQIVRQVSRCLTQKVQDDFHRSMGLPLKKRRGLSWTV